MIISDSTAIIALINIDAFYLLEFLGKRIILSQEVYDEIAVRKKDRYFLDRYIENGFLQVTMPKDRSLFKKLNIFLDKGESASIALAKEMKLPFLIDEKKGRKVAADLGIEVIGLVGIIRFLYLEEKIGEVETRSILEKLDKSNFRISKELIALVMEQ